MASASGTEAQIRSEIERLTATIKQHKELQKHQPVTNEPGYGHYHGIGLTGSNKYVNPNYKPVKYVRPGGSVVAPTSDPPASLDSASSVIQATQPPPQVQGQKKDIVLGGVAFESSERSLVRKDLPRTTAIRKSSKPSTSHRINLKRGQGHVPAFRMKSRHGRNMTLNNSKRPYPSRKPPVKRKFIDKPCARFTTTGSCSRGLTCAYQHDAAKIAICWNFLQDKCSSTAETCNLSHDPTPERTPLCVHFLNKGRCTRNNCPFPHVNVGQRKGVCRDFAVLGYCERGLDCEHQHVRECPDFAETGTCETKGCKLPHVIRANRTRKVGGAEDKKMDIVREEEGQIGDEYISLTFRESESSEEDESEEEEDEEAEEETESDQEMM